MLWNKAKNKLPPPNITVIVKDTEGIVGEAYVGAFFNTWFQAGTFKEVPFDIVKWKYKKNRGLRNKLNKLELAPKNRQFA